jgi:hypothetical protein
MLKSLIACLGIVFVVAVSAQSIQSIEVGTIPKGLGVVMKNAMGEATSILQQVTKNGVIVVFSCNTCPYVIKNQDRTKAVLNWAKEKGIGVIIINSNEDKREGDDSIEAMKKYAEEQGYDCAYVVDENSEVANAFGATRTPEVFYLDNNGVVQYKGAMDDSPADVTKVKRNHLKLAVEEFLSGKAITIKESKGVGCTIKRKG